MVESSPKQPRKRTTPPKKGGANQEGRPPAPRGKAPVDKFRVSSGAPDVPADLLANYEAAKELVRHLEQEWDSRGRPLIGKGGATGRAEVPHPILVMLQNARRDVDRFARAVKSAHRGPRPVAVPGVEPSPAAKLRSVK